MLFITVDVVNEISSGGTHLDRARTNRSTLFFLLFLLLFPLFLFFSFIDIRFPYNKDI